VILLIMTSDSVRVVFISGLAILGLQASMYSRHAGFVKIAR
jgi:hypothetical protein